MVGNDTYATLGIPWHRGRKMTLRDIFKKIFTLPKEKNCVCDHPLPGCQKNTNIAEEEE